MTGQHALSPGLTESERAPLDALAVASLELLGSRTLLRRVDSKFLFARAALPALIERLAPWFSVVPCRGERFDSYETHYFDTTDLSFFHAHRRGVRPRHKVRIRHYAARDVCWLETKTRTRYGDTWKMRRERGARDFALSVDDRSWISGVVGTNTTLDRSAVIAFTRISLVGRDHEERVTLDLSLDFARRGESMGFHHVVIAEIKQPRLIRRSPAMSVFRELNLRRRRISKYCSAITLLASNEPNHVFRPVVRDLRRTDDA